MLLRTTARRARWAATWPEWCWPRPAVVGSPAPGAGPAGAIPRAVGHQRREQQPHPDRPATGRPDPRYRSPTSTTSTSPPTAAAPSWSPSGCADSTSATPHNAAAPLASRAVQGRRPLGLALLRSASSRHAEALPFPGSDSQGQLIERDRHPPAWWLLGRQFVATAPKVLHKAMPGDHDPGAAVLLESPHRPKGPSTGRDPPRHGSWRTGRFDARLLAPPPRARPGTPARGR